VGDEQEQDMELVFRFKNSIGFAKIVLYRGAVSLIYSPFDDRLPIREKPVASIEDAMRDIFRTGGDDHFSLE
jgi:hypothetical protein